MATEQQLKNREIAAGGGTPTEPTSVTEPTSGGFDLAAFGKAIQDRFLNDGGIVSSQDTSLEKAAIATKEAQVAGRESIIGEAERARTEFEESRGETRRDIIARQRGVGFATTQARLEEFDEQTQKTLKDLSDRKKEALRNNDTAAVSKLADLELKEIEFNQQARQQSITNMLNAAGFGLQMQQADRAEYFNKKQEERAVAQQVMAESQFNLQKAQFDYNKIMSNKQFSLDERQVAIAEGNLKMAQEKAGLATATANYNDELNSYIFKLNNVDPVDMEDKLIELKKKVESDLDNGLITPIDAQKLVDELEKYVKDNTPQGMGILDMFKNIGSQSGKKSESPISNMFFGGEQQQKQEETNKTIIDSVSSLKESIGELSKKMSEQSKYFKQK